MNKITAHTTDTAHTADRYISPGWFTHHVFNRFVRWSTRRGLSIAGSRELRLRGHVSGEVRTTVVNVLELEGRKYLVAPRGATEWVRNLRAAGTGELRVGKRVETFRFEELADSEKSPVLHAYVSRWRWEVGQFFEGLSKNPTDDELRAIAAGFPVFAITVEGVAA